MKTALSSRSRQSCFGLSLSWQIFFGEIMNAFTLFFIISLIFACPALAQEQSDEVWPDVEIGVESLPSVMTGMYNQFGRLGLALSDFILKNNSSEPVDFDIVCEIQNYSNEAKAMVTVEPGKTETISLSPLLLPGVSFREVREAAVSYTVFVNEDEYVSETMPLTMYANDTMLWGVVEEGEFINTSVLIAGWVTPHAEVVEALVAKSRKAHPGGVLEGYQCVDCKDEDQWREYTALQVKAIFETLGKKYDISYVNSPIAFSGSPDQMVQKVRLPKDSIKYGTANCVDATVLLASALEAVALDPVVVLIPGHAFLCWDVDGQAGGLDCLESTMLGAASFEDANLQGLGQLGEAVELGVFEEDSTESMLIPISIAREEGIYPMAH